MLFHVALRHSPEHCWARDENEGKATQLVERIEDAEESFGVTVHSSLVAPNEHTFYFVVESEHFESVTGLFGPPILYDHDADITPVTTFAGAMDTLEVK